jgi:gliding motility-associated-like protein
MKKTIIAALIIPWSLLVNAQSCEQNVIAVAGDFYTAGVNELSWTLGEISIETFSGGGHILTQGFQQADLTEKVPAEPVILAMPTALSPNGDGKNDFFVVRGLEVYPDNKIEIFNRWGDLVYSKEGYTKEWHGQNQNGNNLPEATYFVILKVKINNADKILKGYVDVRK